MKKFIKNQKNKRLTVAVGQAWFPAWKGYVKYLKEFGVKVIVLDLYKPDWAARINKVKNQVDAYVWHADTWYEDYRKIHDRIYFIEKFIKKPVLPDMNMYYSYNDKVKQYEIFKYLKLPIIPTYITVEEEKAKKLADKIGYPCIVKDSFGAVGDEVFKIESKKELNKIIKSIFSRPHEENPKKYLYVQKFIPNRDRDLRVVTVGNKIAAAYWREGNGWKHNITAGATANFQDVPKEALNFCLKISKKQKFHWMSYDLFVTPKGKIQLIEWSCNFGVEAPVKEGINIRKIQMEYLINYLKKII